jgi:lysophospholipase L1-like esterase
LQDKWVLLPSEQLEIETATIAFNTIIKNAANSKGLAFVDAHAILNQLANGGILFDTYHFTNQFVQGGAFGLDGVHLTPRANSYIANKFLEAIEKTYGASFKKYKPQDYPFSYPSFLP